MVDEIRRLRVEGIVVDLTDEPADPLFFLAYQGLNDREIMRDYAGLFRAPDDGGIAKPQAAVRMPQAAVRMAQAAVRMPDRIRVGFVSTFFRTHTLGHWMRGLVTMLSRKEFDVTVLSIGHYEDDVANFIREHAEHYVEVPRMVAAARRLIAEQQLDVLFYTDIGLEPITYSLAFSRLAPLQCVTLGHPVTTGIDTIDYYISVEDLETSECSSHYTEKLALLKTLPIHYYRPQPRAPFRDRGHFGLAQEDHVYACLQSPFKFHPDFDELLGGILGGDPLGKLVLTRSLIPHWENLLRQRFATTLPDVVDRIRFLPMMDYNDYLQLLSLADVQLDPLHFGGGSTSYDGFAVGTPIVTAPSKLLRGRITYALCKQMGVLDCVAQSRQEYVQIALRLGTDADYRETVRKKILAAGSLLFECGTGIRELEEFLKRAVRNPH